MVFRFPFLCADLLLSGAAKMAVARDADYEPCFHFPGCRFWRGPLYADCRTGSLFWSKAYLQSENAAAGALDTGCSHPAPDCAAFSAEILQQHALLDKQGFAVDLRGHAVKGFRNECSPRRAGRHFLFHAVRHRLYAGCVLGLLCAAAKCIEVFPVCSLVSAPGVRAVCSVQPTGSRAFYQPSLRLSKSKVRHGTPFMGRF